MFMCVPRNRKHSIRSKPGLLPLQLEPEACPSANCAGTWEIPFIVYRGVWVSCSLCLKEVLPVTTWVGSVTHQTGDIESNPSFHVGYNAECTASPEVPDPPFHGSSEESLWTPPNFNFKRVAIRSIRERAESALCLAWIAANDCFRLYKGILLDKMYLPSFIYEDIALECSLTVARAKMWQGWRDHRGNRVHVLGITCAVVCFQEPTTGRKQALLWDFVVVSGPCPKDGFPFTLGKNEIWDYPLFLND